MNEREVDYENNKNKTQHGEGKSEKNNPTMRSTQTE